MKLILIIIVVIHLVIGDHLFTNLAQSEWKLYKKTFAKSYKNEVEEYFRMNILFANKMKVVQHNILHAQNKTSYKMGLNHLSDRLLSEMTSTMHGLRRDARGKAKAAGYSPSTFVSQNEFVKFPESVDWRIKGAVTPVKNQGFCGSCWTFSATGALEGQIARKFNKLISLSEQDILDCCDYCSGCDGGDESLAFECIAIDGGIESEASYPYEAKRGKCRFNRTLSVASDKGTSHVYPQGDEIALRNAVAIIGPISVAIYAHPHMYQYESGIFYEADCPESKINHAVLVVGYGTEKGVDYWIVKNSWSEKFGEQGYIRIARNRGNVCGIAAEGAFPRI